MSIDLDIFCSVIPFMMLFVYILSVATGFDGCGWPIYAREVFMDVSFWQFSSNPHNSASVADVMTFIVILYSTCNSLFYGGISVIGVLFLDLVLRAEYPPALMCASGSEM